MPYAHVFSAFSRTFSIGNRLSKIATHTDDQDTIYLSAGSRVGVDGAVHYDMNEVDELNSHIGPLLCQPFPMPCLREKLWTIHHDLFDFGG